jgi:hypothetical protein
MAVPSWLLWIWGQVDSFVVTPCVRASIVSASPRPTALG